MMIKNYVFLNATGILPIGAGANFTVPVGAVEVPWDAFDYQKYILIDGEWEVRPVIPEPVVSPEGVVTFNLLPAGAIAIVTDQKTQAVLAEVPVTGDYIEFRLVEPAIYRVVVKMPLPWLNWEGVIQC